MPRFFVEPDAIAAERVTIGGDDARHIAQSLRMQVGETVEIAAAGAGTFVLELETVRPAGVKARIIRRLVRANDPPVTFVLYQGLAKGERMDFVVQKAVELGAARIVPFISQTCVVQLDPAKAAKRRERWQRIALAAAQQSFRDEVPAVDLPIRLDAVEERIASGSYDLAVLPYEREQAVTVSGLQAVEPAAIAVIIGPEGGFLPQEVHGLVTAGAQCISLGPRILRTETAGIAALTLLGARFGDLDRGARRQ